MPCESTATSPKPVEATPKSAPVPLSLWVLDAAGSAEQAGAWLATTTGTTQMTGAVPVMLNDISVIQLRDAGSAVLAEVPLGRQGTS
ncbi:hypothetical protein ACLQ8T_02980 [Glutamicibacter sp. FR1]|uniref:hypothetical protein n=1 Tax=Glutamicibacter sp. FR1 TaxID=3393744 RepID=UPI0039AF92BB